MALITMLLPECCRNAPIVVDNARVQRTFVGDMLKEDLSSVWKTSTIKIAKQEKKPSASMVRQRKRMQKRHSITTGSSTEIEGFYNHGMDNNNKLSNRLVGRMKKRDSMTTATTTATGSNMEVEEPSYTTVRRSRRRPSNPEFTTTGNPSSKTSGQDSTVEAARTRRKHSRSLSNDSLKLPSRSVLSGLFGDTKRVLERKHSNNLPPSQPQRKISINPRDMIQLLPNNMKGLAFNDEVDNDCKKGETSKCLPPNRPQRKMSGCKADSLPLFDELEESDSHHE